MCVISTEWIQTKIKYKKKYNKQNKKNTRNLPPPPKKNPNKQKQDKQWSRV